MLVPSAQREKNKQHFFRLGQSCRGNRGSPGSWNTMDAIQALSRNSPFNGQRTAKVPGFTLLLPERRRTPLGLHVVPCASAIPIPWIPHPTLGCSGFSPLLPSLNTISGVCGKRLIPSDFPALCSHWNNGEERLKSAFCSGMAPMEQLFLGERSWLRSPH